jgi:hypothetical protein
MLAEIECYRSGRTHKLNRSAEQLAVQYWACVNSGKPVVFLHSLAKEFPNSGGILCNTVLMHVVQEKLCPKM